MRTLKSLNSVGAFYFYLLALGYLALAFAFRNGVMPQLMVLAMRTLDLPLALAALLYGGTAVCQQINAEREDLSPWVMVVGALCLGLMTSLTVAQLSLPSQI